MSTPVSSIGASLIASAAKVSSGSAANSSVAAAVAEANESKATTIKEAQNGDRVAKRKLAALQAAQQAEQSKASEPGKGKVSTTTPNRYCPAGQSHRANTSARINRIISGSMKARNCTGFVVGISRRLLVPGDAYPSDVGFGLRGSSCILRMLPHMVSPVPGLLLCGETHSPLEKFQIKPASLKTIVM